MDTDKQRFPQIGGYDTESVLGEGGMATVYLAVQQSLARYVALKVMNKLLSMDADFCKRFDNEGRLIAKLSHPNIVTVHDIGAVEDIHYLSMTYLPGGTLSDKLRRGLPLDQALAILRSLADALGYAHRHEIVHRDIKPGNVLFTESGTPVLTDFGIAKTVGNDTKLTSAGMMLGSAGYMSPEQAIGKEVDNRSDLYSLGVLFWEMLTGALPFHAQDPFALALKHVTDPIPRLPERLRLFAPLFEGLMAKQVEDRFASADELIEIIDGIPSDDIRSIPPPTMDKTLVVPGNSGQMPGGSPDASKSGEGLQPPSRSRAGLLIALIAVLAVAGTAGFLGFKGSRGPAREASDSSTQTPSPSVAGEPGDPTGEPAQRSQHTASLPQDAPSGSGTEANGDTAPTAESEPPRGDLAKRGGARNVEALLGKAEHQWKAGRLTEPAGDNAFESYSQVLELDPEHAAAKQKLIQIGRIKAANRVFELADALLRGGKIDDARRLIETGLKMNPDDERLLALKRALDY